MTCAIQISSENFNNVKSSNNYFNAFPYHMCKRGILDKSYTNQNRAINYVNLWELFTKFHSFCTKNKVLNFALVRSLYKVYTPHIVIYYSSECRHMILRRTDTIYIALMF